MAITVKIVKYKIPLNGETSAVNPSYSKSVADAIGATATGNTHISTTRAGRYIIATILLFS